LGISPPAAGKLEAGVSPYIRRLLKIMMDEGYSSLSPVVKRKIPIIEIFYLCPSVLL
jgi:hypothetical protein